MAGSLLPGEQRDCAAGRTRVTAGSASVVRMRLSRTVIVLLAVAAAVVVNLAIYLIGGAAGASFRFPGADGVAIPWFVVAGLTVVPLGVALAAVALLAPRWRWVIPAGLIAAPVLALVSIPLMPVPVGFDLGTTIGLSLMHVVVGIAGLLGVLGIRARLAGQPASRSTIGSSASA